MITEIAQIEIKPGSEMDFEAAIAKAQPIFQRCKGWKSFELHRSIEKPSRPSGGSKPSTLTSIDVRLNVLRCRLATRPAASTPGIC